MRDWKFWTLAGLVLLLSAGGLAGVSAAGSGSGEEMAAKAAQLTEHLRAGRFADVEQAFDENMKAALPPGRLQAVWRSLLAQLGELRSTGQPYVAVQGPPAQVRQPAAFAKGLVDLLYAFDGAGRLAGFWVTPHVQPPATGDDKGAAGAPDPAAAVPPYVDRGLFTEIELSFGDPPFVLPGTLTLPKGPGPFPGVVLVHGSGPNDRDETIGPNKPFRDLAWGLATRGIAVFRYDKRTRVHGTRLDPLQITLDAEVVDDALAAVELLASRPEISRVVVVGHSLGASLAPTIASRSERVAGIVLLAATARPISEVLVEQVRYLAGLDQRVTPEEQAEIDKLRGAMERLASGSIDPSESVLGAPAAYWAQLEALDPVGVAKSLSTPMLILQGGRDYQVTRADFERLQKGLAGREGVSFHLFPTLNHLFMAGTGPSTPTEYEQPGHVDQQVVEHVARWILGG